MSNQISVSADHLETIFEQLVLLTLDIDYIVLALQAVQEDCEVSGGVINAVIMALSGNAAMNEDLSDQLDSILSAQTEGVSDDA